MEVESETILAEFNLKFNKQGAFIQKHYHYDVDDAVIFYIYALVREVNSESGKAEVNAIGGFNAGDFFESGVSTEKSGYFLSCGRTVDAYPVSRNELSIDCLRVPYKRQCFETNSYNSTFSFSRWWVSSFDDIEYTHPQAAEKIKIYLNEQIALIANIQREQNYKSTWVYYRFIDNLDKYGKYVNGILLKDTTYFYSPLIYFNAHAHKFTTLSSREKKEIEYRIY